MLTSLAQRLSYFCFASAALVSASLDPQYIFRPPQLASCSISSNSSNSSSSSTTTNDDMPGPPPAAGSGRPRGAVVALSHGGGPMPVLGDPGHASITSSLKTRVPSILRLNHPDPALRPRAIVVVTAHWQASRPSISSGASPALLYDYGGFPDAAYRLRYDAPGEPAVAAELADLLRLPPSSSSSSSSSSPEDGGGGGGGGESGGGGFPEVTLDPHRGWDHGTFVPLILAHPPADVPVVQLSVLRGDSPEAHHRLGRALRRLRDSNVAVLGSGFASFHNLRLLFSGAAARDPSFPARQRAWNAALAEAVRPADPAARARALAGYRGFPGGAEMHPPGAAEHLMPLLVCAGAAAEGEEVGTYTDDWQGMEILSFYWG